MPKGQTLEMFLHLLPSSPPLHKVTGDAGQSVPPGELPIAVSKQQEIIGAAELRDGQGI